jgi:O-antigen/teichoic acid export membrane protein
MMYQSDSHTADAVVWASIETLLRQGLQFGAVIVLARLLTPRDFGLIAMLSIFTAFATLLVNGGFAAALIQQRTENDTDSSTVFWFNIASGTLMALMLGLSAPLITRFFGHPQLAALTWAMALNVWLVSWMTVHVALLTRHLDFRTQAKASGIANLVGAVLAVVMAIRGAGVWALVAQTLSVTLLNVVMLWLLHPWRPTATFSIRSFRKLFGFGGFMLASSLIDTSCTRVYSVLIGKLYTSSDLGIYTRAVSTRDFSQGILGSIFSRVALPVLSRHRDAPSALRMRLKAANQLTMAVNLPAMLGLAMVSNVAVPTLFGYQWNATVPLLQILCIAGAVYPLQISNLQVLMAQGHSQLLFRLEIVKKATLLVSMLIASRWGMQAIAWSTVFSALVAFLVNAHYSRALIGYGPLKQLRDILAYLTLTAFMMAILALLGYTLSWLTPGKRLLVELAAGAVSYLSVAAMLRLPAIAQASEVLRSLHGRVKNPPDITI